MKKLLIVIFVCVLSTSIQSCATNKGPVTQTATNATACAALKAKGATAEQLARRGCCSHHSGVCGCSGGRQLCCDGTYSPTCTCDKEDTPKASN